MKKKYIVVLSIAILLLFLGGFLFIMRPLHYRQTATVYSLDEGALEVTFDVTLHRYLWRADEMHGKIVADGVEYTSLVDWAPRSAGGASADYTWNRFGIPMPYMLDSNNNDQVILDLLGPHDFDNYRLWVIHPDSTSTIYYGPAASEAEVQDIVNRTLSTAK